MSGAIRVVDRARDLADFDESAFVAGRFVRWDDDLGRFVGATVTSASGTVTSVAIAADSFITVTGSPVTGAGTITLSFPSQSQGLFLASPFDEAGEPTFRALHADDVPALTAAKVSDFDTQVRLSRLDQMAAPTGSVAMGGQKITAVGTPSSSAEAATKGYVDGATYLSSGTGIAISASTIALAANVITAGTYTSLTVDTYGRATAGADLITSNGIAVRTASGTFTNRTVTGTAGRIDVTAGDGVAGNPTLDLASGIVTAGAYTSVTVDTYGRVTAGADVITGNGIAVRTASGTFTNRTITGTSNRLTVTAGDGVSGNPTLDISSSYAGQNTIVTLGTITTGTWTGTAIAVLNGGTGATSASGARTNLGAAGKYTALIGDNAATSFAITQATHGLAGDGAMIADIFNASTGARAGCDISINNANGTVTFSFTNPPATNAYRIVIIG